LKHRGIGKKIKIPLNKMYPSWRGRKLDMQNFSKNHIDEIAFLISNKKEEQFKLLIEKIELKK
jgi:NADH dehydrogenase [ubiquinone] 1 alpha subcomplex assembly factor 1